MKHAFADFTNLYALTKTLRFELKPHPLTKSLIEVIKEDKEIDRLYNEEMKPMLDTLHEKFITEALKDVVFSINDLEQLEEYLNELKDLKQKIKSLNKDKEKNKKAISSVRKAMKELENGRSGKIPKLQTDLRAVIVSQFNEVGSSWKKIYEKKGVKFKSDDNKDMQGHNGCD